MQFILGKVYKECFVVNLKYVYNIISSYPRGFLACIILIIIFQCLVASNVLFEAFIFVCCVFATFIPIISFMILLS
jgi:hypothetical protein